MKILNLAAGKLNPLDLPENYFLIQLDTMYYNVTKPILIEHDETRWDPSITKVHKCNEDAFEYMERTSIMFDRICAYRFLEHVSMDKVSYFIYLMSTCLNIGGTIDIIVPNYRELAKLLLEDDTSDEHFDSKNILLTTELLNEPSCPHASIWTVDRLHYFFCELEGRFKMIGHNSIDRNFEFDGRDIYLRGRFERIK